MTEARKPIGVLFVHGLNGGVNDFAELPTLLEQPNWLVRLVLLPGHGPDVRWREQIRYGWQEWAASVREELYQLQQHCSAVFLIGHSLGGALCLHIAAHKTVAGVVSMCAPLFMRPWMLPAVRLSKYVAPLLPSLREDICDPEARKRYPGDGYRWTPMKPVESMLLYLPQLRQELPRITVPTLVIAASQDHVVPVRDGYEIYRRLGSREKHLLIVRHSYHVVMKDHDREEVFARTLAFLHRHIPGQK
ncbi:carboxylesterase [Thermosporothrix hazakensis]|jgi:carboxylesterase|uniref:Carboxylesterase n=1 Tax=Thermosporothrix hazakensis TaxID=644383 RepID=A0A326UF96_THEHA|nr:alpha/beta fold hydrolase [Thermosporothrix hazakensis]PZW36585.1 carboxylesterase [Thermosporothrix hazakensis]GCE47236.1 esterase [Thermosporothrix hazakensis]